MTTPRIPTGTAVLAGALLAAILIPGVEAQSPSQPETDNAPGANLQPTPVGAAPGNDTPGQDGICAQVPDPNNAGALIDDDTDPDCHEPGLIYQEIPDTQIDLDVDTTGVDWVTNCRAHSVTVGPTAPPSSDPPHTWETTTRTYVTGGGSSGCATWTAYQRDNGRRDRTVLDCRLAGAHSTAAGDGHAHRWLAEPWEPWVWTPAAAWVSWDISACDDDDNPGGGGTSDPIVVDIDPGERPTDDPGHDPSDDPTGDDPTGDDPPGGEPPGGVPGDVQDAVDNAGHPDLGRSGKGGAQHSTTGGHVDLSDTDTGLSRPDGNDSTGSNDNDGNDGNDGHDGNEHSGDGHGYGPP